MGNGHSPVVVDVVRKIVLGLRQIHDPDVKLVDFELACKECLVGTFKLVLEFDLESCNACFNSGLFVFDVRRIRSAFSLPPVALLRFVSVAVKLVKLRLRHLI